MNCKILIVDDEVLTGMYFQMRFKRLGYQVLDPVATADEAVRTAASEKPAYILMDIRLAGTRDGIDAATDIKQIYSPGIIFMTGFMENEIKERALSLNPVAFLVKPVTLDIVENVIKLNEEKHAPNPGTDGIL